jgi:SAM-dependent methyltransferase
MINKIHSKFYRPEKGWDPVPSEHVAMYGQVEWSLPFRSLVDKIENKIGSLVDKEVIDLGAGPGHYASEFAKRGAKVTWFDISRRYMEFCRSQQNDEMFKHPMEFYLGYLEESLKLVKTYDFVFNRGCWLYGMNDFDYPSILYSLLKDGGWAYCMVNHLGYLAGKQISLGNRIKIALNELLRIKIGHPFPSKKRVQCAIANQPFKKIHYDIDPNNLYIWLQR